MGLLLSPEFGNFCLGNNEHCENKKIQGLKFGYFRSFRPNRSCKVLVFIEKNIWCKFTKAQTGVTSYKVRY